MRSAEEKLRAARATFGASSCHLLRVHSGTDGAGREVPWADLISAPLSGGGAGEPLERPAAPSEARPDPLCFRCQASGGHVRMHDVHARTWTSMRSEGLPRTDASSASTSADEMDASCVGQCLSKAAR